MEIKLLLPAPLDTVTATGTASAAVQCIWQHLIGRAEVTCLCSSTKESEKTQGARQFLTLDKTEKPIPQCEKKAQK